MYKVYRLSGSRHATPWKKGGAGRPMKTLLASFTTVPEARQYVNGLPSKDDSTYMIEYPPSALGGGGFDPRVSP